MIVTFAGHGGVDDRGNFYFCPSDYDERRKLSTGVYWNLFKDTLKLPCPVWVVVDCCHSGAITEKGLRGPDAVEGAVRRGGDAVAAGNGKIALTAACLAGEFARERSEWQHGALTLALLEGLNGKPVVPTNLVLPRPGSTGALNVENLTIYASQRVLELTKEKQAAHTNQTGNFPLARTWVGKRNP